MPAAVRLTAYDLVEWMTFVQSVRDGTYHITRPDLLWPLVGIALLTALSSSHFQGASGSGSAPRFSPAFLSSVFFRPLNLGCLALALFASYLILPAYPFLITAYRDPELAPQFWLGIATGIAALLGSAFALLRPGWAFSLIPVISLISLVTSIRAFLIIRQPIAEVLTHPAPVGYGFVLAVAGMGGLTLLSGIELGRSISKSAG